MPTDAKKWTFPLATAAFCLVFAGIAASGTQAKSSKSRMSGAPPASDAKGFENLDAYLAHRRRLGAIDKAFFERRADGRYRLVTGRARSSETFTRAQLMKRYGFRR